MSGPGVVCIKRKRSLPAPDVLFVEPPGKRPKHHVQYILRRDGRPDSERSNDIHNSRQDIGQRPDPANDHEDPQSTVTQLPSDGNPSHPAPHAERRIFHLKRPNAPNGNATNRRHGENGIAMFVERRAQKHRLDSAASQTGEDGATKANAASEEFKRPSKRAAVPGNAVPALAVPRHDMEGIAESLHQFALEEASKEKPKTSRMPKLSGQRSREIHQQRIMSAAAQQQDQDVDMDKDEDTDYVYDTYVLAPTVNAGAAQVEAQGSSGSVGYLVITEEDQKIWEEYIEDEPSDKDWDSDEDDENAEDWYGADYPEEELAMDDEFDENPYKYHDHPPSDDEGWDSNDHSWSDDEYERQTQPWGTKTAKRYRKYLERCEVGEEDEDEDEGAAADVDEVDGNTKTKV